MATTRKKRSWQPREMQMVVEWLMQFYPGDAWKTRVRLGAPKSSTPRADMTPEERAMVGVWRRWADALIFLPDRLILVEAAIRSQPGKISQLELYRLLLPKTPELAEHMHKPIELVLLYAIEDPAVVLLARSKGIRCILFKPMWLDDYLALLQPRERRAPRSGLIN